MLAGAQFLLTPVFGFAQFEILSWSDEFNGTGSPNPTYWKYDLGSNGWGNNEVQNYTNSTQNVRQENGSLVIDAIKTGNEWTSARIITLGKMSFTYGRIVFRAKLPTGSGTWPALWMLGDNLTSVGWPGCGEVDVMEHVGRNPGVVQSAMHTPSSFGNTQNKGSLNVPTFSTEFHDYEVSWTADKMDFKLDGNIYYTYQPTIKNSSTWPFDKPCFFIMNVAMGGNFGSDPQFENGSLKNGIDPALTKARMEVDYLRVYQMTTQTLSGLTEVSKGQKNLIYSTNEVSGATYTWSVPTDASIVSGQGTSSVVVNWGQTKGNIKITMVYKGISYSKTITVGFPIVTGMIGDDLDMTNEWTVSPNPSTGLVKLQGRDQETQSIAVLNMLGEEQQINILNEWIDLTDLSKSVYVVRMLKNNKPSFKRIILH